MVEIPAGDEDWAMPEPVTVWAVETHLGPEERKGTLSLELDVLLFSPASGGHEIRIALSEVEKARRLRGSPVLLIVHREGQQVRRTAFYFVQPPPLDAVLGRSPELEARPTLLPRSTRRRARKQNVGYLGLANREKKPVVREWESAVRDAAARGGDRT